MAETLEETLNKRKTRVSSSDESSISNASPESKKLKSGEHAVRVHEVSELDTEEDVSLPALNMTEEFSDTLQNILKKLDKLDSIEKSMKDFQATLLKLEGPFLRHQKHDGNHCVGDITCKNGCCRNNPCLNGGACTDEICEPISVRYKCSCANPFVGKHCEIQLRSLFCDFNSEPGFAWNLIESLRNLKKSNTDGTVYTDYLRASFEDFDLVRVTPTLVSNCQKYELVNIRGNECANCMAATWYLKGSLALHIDSSISLGCDFDGNQSGDVVASEDNFGVYHDVNSKFRCTSSSEATTQFWVGGK
ncbi:uncharacterized protein LOC110053328 [Orbicella faveolata]|uniref:uncharacterized protein LOC110053328 n=1 Tax=Orbicella faveolata TaxID=48498 RepID=UPI0009E45737|nr:uncharacterized protein LOC110053328 [Orbicella faveolata]